MAVIDIVGLKSGLLTVISFAKIHEVCGSSMWLCSCECGKEVIVKRTYLVANKVSQSCGCYKSKLSSDRGKNNKYAVRHGLYNGNRRLFTIWTGMKTRCFNTKVREYHQYGGRGITMLEEWRLSFTVFYEWAISTGYNDSLSIDRIDVNGSYVPENCRWATTMEQSRNRRNSRLYTYNGVTRNSVDWATLFGISVQVLNQRIKLGWTMEKALTVSTKGKHRKNST